MTNKKDRSRDRQVHQKNKSNGKRNRPKADEQSAFPFAYEEFSKDNDDSSQYSVHDREKAVSRREELVDLREKEAFRLEENDILRKKLEKTEKELELAKATQDAATKDHLREANERLIISTINAQTMKETAETATLNMAHMAQHDSLTGLPNRSLLKERLSQAIGLASRHGNQLALMFLDLDLFKQINDSLGHQVGDELLKSVAKRLTSCVRSTDTVCRLGGDEFVIMLAEINHPRVAAQIAEKIHKSFSDPFIIGEHEINVDLSIGISVYPDDSQDTDTLIKNADTAMYHAKENGRNHFEFFEKDMNAKAVSRMFLEKSLRRALSQKEFILHYQPKINLVSGEMTGSEALIRWLDSDLGIMYPDDFLWIAEESRLIVEIDEWVIQEACHQVKKWLDSGLPALSVAVNVSAFNFRDKHFLENISLILEKTGLPPDYLELELTENILMGNAESSVSILKALKNMGIKLSIDDFGMGSSSMSYLKRFPIDTLKIDRSFVNKITLGKDDAAIVSAVIGMGKSFNQRVIAEGVETPEQLFSLQTLECDEGQGFYFNHPMPAEDFTSLLQTSKEVRI
ncbi:MAG: putative bifunctional diguanylate cyclase/phosphodiesterase [Bacteroidota bacterium]